MGKAGLTTTELLTRLSAILGETLSRRYLYTLVTQGIIEAPNENTNGKARVLSWPSKTVTFLEARVAERKEKMLANRKSRDVPASPPPTTRPSKKKPAPVKAPVKRAAKKTPASVPAPAKRSHQKKLAPGEIRQPRQAPEGFSPAEAVAWAKKNHIKLPVFADKSPVPAKRRPSKRPPAITTMPLPGVISAFLKKQEEENREAQERLFVTMRDKLAAAEKEAGDLRLIMELQKALEETRENQVKILEDKLAEALATNVTQRTALAKGTETLKTSIEEQQEEQRRLLDLVKAEAEVELSAVKNEFAKERKILRRDMGEGHAEAVATLNARLTNTDAALVRERAKVKQLEDAARDVEKEAQTSIAAWKAKMDEVEARTKNGSASKPAESPSNANLLADVVSLRNKVKRLELALAKNAGDPAGALSVAESNMIKAWLFGMVCTQTHQAKHQPNIAELPAEIGLKIIETFDLKFEFDSGALRLHSTPRDPIVVDTGVPLALRKVREKLAQTDSQQSLPLEHDSSAS